MVQEGYKRLLEEATTEYKQVPNLECREGDPLLVGIAKPVPQIQSDDIYKEFVKKLKVVKNATMFENCNFYTEEFGYECVPYYQCDEDGTILTDGAGLIDIRFGDDEVASVTLDLSDKKCPGTLDVCCQDPDWEPSTYTTPTTTTTTTRSTSTTTEYGRFTTTTTKTTTTTTATTTTTITSTTTKKPYVSKCGQHNEQGLGLRISGQADESQFAEWPHVCVVLEKKILGGKEVKMFRSGASLIAPGIILTAAHSVKNLSPDKAIVRCGEWDTQTKNEPLPHQDRNVRKIFSHPEFHKSRLSHDYALIFTERDFDLNRHLDTVCLPDVDEDFSDEKQCWVAGWGKDSFGAEGKYQVVMKDTAMPMLNHSFCQQSFRENTRLPKRFKLHSTFVCAGADGNDACTGDGGGPLVCPMKRDPNRVVQVGIVAWGIGCGEVGVPGAYAAVAKEVCWIDFVSTCEMNKRQQQFQQNSYFGYNEKCQPWLRSKSRRWKLFQNQMSCDFTFETSSTYN